jgi:hypothetical protein
VLFQILAALAAAVSDLLALGNVYQGESVFY